MCKCPNPCSSCLEALGLGHVATVDTPKETCNCHGRAAEAISKEEWRRRYKEHLKSAAKLTEEEAQDVLEGGLEDFDYSDEPESAAAMELSYWGD